MMTLVFKIFFNQTVSVSRKRHFSYSASLVIGNHWIKVESRLAKINCSMSWAYGAAYEWVLATYLCITKSRRRDLSLCAVIIMCSICIAEQAETTKPGEAFGLNLYRVCALVPELTSCFLPAHGWAQDWT